MLNHRFLELGSSRFFCVLTLCLAYVLSWYKTCLFVSCGSIIMIVTNFQLTTWLILCADQICDKPICITICFSSETLTGEGTFILFMFCPQTFCWQLILTESFMWDHWVLVPLHWGKCCISDLHPSLPLTVLIYLSLRCTFILTSRVIVKHMAMWRKT